MSQDYIKRVVGVPGDKITYENKRLTVNGKAVEYTAAGRLPGRRAPDRTHKQFMEKLPGVSTAS